MEGQREEKRKRDGGRDGGEKRGRELSRRDCILIFRREIRFHGGDFVYTAELVYLLHPLEPGIFLSLVWGWLMLEVRMVRLRVAAGVRRALRSRRGGGLGRKLQSE